MVSYFLFAFKYLYILFILIIFAFFLLLIFFILAFIIYSLTKIYYLKRYRPRKFNFDKDFYILGHRGIPVLEHENTLESFDLLYKYDIDGTEFDVNISKDNELYVYHDYKLYRFFGIDKQLKEISSNRIDSLKISLFSSNKSKDIIKLTKIPKLEEVFEKIKDCRLLNLEIKSNSLKNIGLEERVANLIKKFGLEKKMVISSFDPFCLNRFSKFLPEVPRGLLVSKTGLARYLRKMWFLAFSKADFIHFDAAYIGEPIIDKMKKRGYSLVYWGVNSIQLLDRAVKDKPVFIISDIPHILKEYY